MSSPKEFWVEVIKDSVLPANRILRVVDYEMAEYAASFSGDTTIEYLQKRISVIEKSAFIALQVENELLKIKVKELEEYKYLYEGLCK